MDKRNVVCLLFGTMLLASLSPTGVADEVPKGESAEVLPSFLAYTKKVLEQSGPEGPKVDVIVDCREKVERTPLKGGERIAFHGRDEKLLVASNASDEKTLFIRWGLGKELSLERVKTKRDQFRLKFTATAGGHKVVGGLMLMTEPPSGAGCPPRPPASKGLSKGGLSKAAAPGRGDGENVKRPQPPAIKPPTDGTLVVILDETPAGYEGPKVILIGVSFKDGSDVLKAFDDSTAVATAP